MSTSSGNSPSLQYEDAPSSLPRLSTLSEAADQSLDQSIDQADEFNDSLCELQPSPPQSPMNAGTSSMPIPIPNKPTHSQSIYQSINQSNEQSKPSLPQLSTSADSTVLEDGELTEALTPLARPFSFVASSSFNTVAMPVASPVTSPNNQTVNPATTQTAPPSSQSTPPKSAEKPSINQSKHAEWVKAQSQRAAALSAEFQSINQLISQRNQFWAVQEARSTALINRSEVAHRTSNELARYLTQSVRSINQSITELSQTNNPSTQSLGSSEIGSMKVALQSIEKLRTVSIDSMTQLKDKKMNNAMLHTQAMCRVMAERQRVSTEMVTNINRETKKEQEIMRDLWTSYERSVRERSIVDNAEKTSRNNQTITSINPSTPQSNNQTNNQSNSQSNSFSLVPTRSFVLSHPVSTISVKTDPYLSLRALLINQSINSLDQSTPSARPAATPSINQSTDAHAKHRRELVALFLDQQTEEQRRIEQSKNMLIDYLGGINQLLNQLGSQVADCLTAVRQIDAKQDLNQFLANNQLTLTDQELDAYLASFNPNQSNNQSNDETIKQSTESESNSSDNPSTVSSSEPSESNDATQINDEPVSSTDPLDDNQSSESTTQSSTTDSTSSDQSNNQSINQQSNNLSNKPSASSSQPRKASSVAPTSSRNIGSTADDVPSVFHVPPPTPSSSFWSRVSQLEVSKSGLLARPGRFFKANWKPQHVVLTRAGYLHCFEDADALQPAFSLSLADCSASSSQSAIEVRHSYTPVFGKKETQTLHPFRAANPKEAQEWCKAINEQCYVSSQQ